MPFSTSENESATDLVAASALDLDNGNHRANLPTFLNKAGIVGRAISRIAGEIQGALTAINALSTDTDGAIAQYVQADASLRFGVGGIQKHVATAIVNDAGHTLTTNGANSSIWISPDGTEATAGSYTTTASGSHQLWMPTSGIGTGVLLRVNVGGNLIGLTFSPSSPVSEITCTSNSIGSLFVQGLPLETLKCAGSGIPDLNLSGIVTLSYIECHANGFSQAVVDKIIADVLAYGTINGYLRINLTNAAPSATGAANAQTLRDNGWTVLHS